MGRRQLLQSRQSLHRLRRQHARFAVTQYVLHVRHVRLRAQPPQPASRVMPSGRYGRIVEILRDRTLDTPMSLRPPPATISKSIYYISRFW